MLLYILLGLLVKTTAWNEWRRCLSPFPLAEELSCAVSWRVLRVPVTALDRSSGSQHYANLWTVCGCECVCTYVCLYVCMLPSEHLVDRTPQCQWHIEQVQWESPGFPPCCVYSVYLLPKNTLKSITSLFFPQFFTLYISPLFTPDFYWLVVWNQLHVR